MSESLRSRVITAAVLIALLLAVLFGLPAGATVITLTLTVLVGAWEWSGFVEPRRRWVRGAYVLLIAAALALAWRFSATRTGIDVVLSGALLWWLVALAWITLAPQRVGRGAAAVAGVCALVPAWVALARLRLDGVRGAEWVLFCLLLVWVADIGAYFTGRRFGRRRLAPRVSPAKTWEGALGGILSCIPVAIAGSFWFSVPLGRFVVLCLAAAGFSIVGDLTESLLKRFAGVKDSGRLFPGHGGVMDRIDSLTGAAPVLLLGLTMMGVMS